LESASFTWKENSGEGIGDSLSDTA